jgi:hypothetical protein
MSQLAYKFLAHGAIGPVSEYAWPSPGDAAPGEWTEASTPLQLCASGVHVCRVSELAHWLHDELWVVEVDGETLEGIDRMLVQRARLLYPLEEWRNGIAAARFARAARDHAAALVATAPTSAQPRLTQYVGDASYHLPNGSTALAAFCAAMAVAWFHGGDHFDGEAYRRERDWQSSFIAADLKL